MKNDDTAYMVDIATSVPFFAKVHKITYKLSSTISQNHPICYGGRKDIYLFHYF